MGINEPQRTNLPNAITDVPGITVGHWTNRRAATGCTVILCESGATAGVDVRGAAPGTRETDLMRPMNLVQQVHGIVLAGGSAFGLDSAGGVMRHLEARRAGFRIRRWRVPIVGAAVLMDLAVGNGSVRPDAEAGFQASVQAVNTTVEEGSVGAGTGATVAKALGSKGAVKGGVGTASEMLADGTVVGAIVAVNAFGEIIDPETGALIAGPRGLSGGIESTLEVLKQGRSKRLRAAENTTIGVVATNARLNKEQTNKVAQMAQDGLSIAIRPAHTMADGDTIFALATSGLRTRSRPNVSAIGAVAARTVAQAIVRGVRRAEGLAGVPSVDDLLLTTG